jgi:hypothetical protein
MIQQNRTNMIPKSILKNKPKFIPHKCKSEDSCVICKNYVNMLDNYRQFYGNKLIDKLPKDKMKRLLQLPKSVRV